MPQLSDHPQNSVCLAQTGPQEAANATSDGETEPQQVIDLAQTPKVRDRASTVATVSPLPLMALTSTKQPQLHIAPRGIPNLSWAMFKKKFQSAFIINF